jgi:hypothetical protein
MKFYAKNKDPTTFSDHWSVSPQNWFLIAFLRNSRLSFFLKTLEVVEFP